MIRSTKDLLLLWGLLTFSCSHVAPRPEPAPAPSAALEPSREVSVYVSSKKGIQRFGLDLETGALREHESVEAGSGSTFLAWTPDRRFVYALDRGASNRVLAFARDPVTFRLTPLGGGDTGIGSSPHLSVHPSGRWVLVADYAKGQVSVLPIAADGRVGPPADLQRPVETKAHMILPSPDGRYVLVPATGANRVAQLVFDAATGKLTPNDPPFIEGSAPDAQPRHLAFHPSGRFVYVINERNDTLSTYGYDAGAGTLTHLESLPTLPPDFDGADNTCAHVVVAPSGAFVYGSNRGHDSIVIYRVDPQTGRLTLVGHETGRGQIETPRNFTVDPSGTFLLVANQRAASLLVFRIRPDGTLALVGGPVPCGKGPTFVGVVS
jgi:6-phosphogluconolactonase